MTSVLGRPLGLIGAASILYARSAVISKGPPFLMPKKLILRFSPSRTARVTSMLRVRSGLISETDFSLSCRKTSVPLSKAIIEIRTAAPSNIHGSSDHAANMSPVSLIRLSVSRLTPPRMLLVASNPARFVSPCQCAIELSRRSNSKGQQTCERGSHIPRTILRDTRHRVPS
ncbi:hypothetical protein BH24CHL4_BH24CHL4_00170 [soil metagenome]